MESRRCIKCEREIVGDETVCEICNRAGMATPSATQYHGTIAVAIVLAVAALAFAGSLATRGIGPYDANVQSWRAGVGGGLEVTLAVENEGSQAGRAKCRVVASDASGRQLRTRSVLTPAIEPGDRTVIVERLPGVTGRPDAVTVECS